MALLEGPGRGSFRPQMNILGLKADGSQIPGMEGESQGRSISETAHVLIILRHHLLMTLTLQVVSALHPCREWTLHPCHPENGPGMMDLGPPTTEMQKPQGVQLRREGKDEEALLLHKEWGSPVALGLKIGILFAKKDLGALQSTTPHPEEEGVETGEEAAT